MPVRAGTLRVADAVLCGSMSGKVREIRPMRERIERGGDDRPGRGRGEGGGSAAREASS